MQTIDDDCDDTSVVDAAVELLTLLSIRTVNVKLFDDDSIDLFEYLLLNAIAVSGDSWRLRLPNLDGTIRMLLMDWDLDKMYIVEMVLNLVRHCCCGQQQVNLNCLMLVLPLAGQNRKVCMQRGLSENTL